MILLSGKYMRHTLKMLASLVVVLILVSILAGCAPATETNGQTPSLYDEDRVISLYEESIPSVVMIIVEIAPLGAEAQGSGFIIDDQGHIITNNHVVQDATQIIVILYNDVRLEATIVGTDIESDLALIQVDAGRISGIRPLPLGDSDSLKPGQMAIALGSPFGLDGSITVGVLSGLGRSLTSTSQRPNPDILQTDAAINPGNSGGPLLNSSGQVIGINTAIEVSSTGIGFAVPINTVKSLLPALLKGGEVKNPWLGVSAVAISPGLVELLQLPVSTGIYIVTVTPESPAEKAGLIGSGSDELGQPALGGDIITAVDGIQVSSVEDLVAYLNNKQPGDRILLSVLRGSQALTIEVTLGEWPE